MANLSITLPFWWYDHPRTFLHPRWISVHHCTAWQNSLWWRLTVTACCDRLFAAVLVVHNCWEDLGGKCLTRKNRRNTRFVGKNQGHGMLYSRIWWGHMRSNDKEKHARLAVDQLTNSSSAGILGCRVSAAPSHERVLGRSIVMGIGCYSMLWFMLEHFRFVLLFDPFSFYSWWQSMI